MGTTAGPVKAPETGNAFPQPCRPPGGSRAGSGGQAGVVSHPAHAGWRSCDAARLGQRPSSIDAQHHSHSITYLHGL
jgi:hypothetical protein